MVGGHGTRAMPFSLAINKCLLPVNDEPILYNSIRLLGSSGISEIAFVGDERCLCDIKIMLSGSLSSFNGIDFSYCVQEKQTGLIDAFYAMRNFVAGGRGIVMLGDNIFTQSVSQYIERFSSQKSGARILLYVSKDCHNDLGVADVVDDRLVKIIKRTNVLPGQHIATGCMMYDEALFDVIGSIDADETGATSVNNKYASGGLLEYDVIDGYWADAGTNANRVVVDGLLRDLKN